MIRVVAVDGPAASGKSSTGADVARHFGFLHVDSGALYRGVTRVALDTGGNGSTEDILAAADRRGLGFRVIGDRAVLHLDGSPIGESIRDQVVTARVSAISAIPEVRDWVNRSLRALLDTGRTLVVDGRDIGTAVFPEAPVKIYLDAAPEVRARRRLIQRQTDTDAGEPGRASVAEEAERLRVRDDADASRKVAPLRPAEDATHVDTEDLTLQEQVELIVKLIHRSPLPIGRSGG